MARAVLDRRVAVDEGGITRRKTVREVSYLSVAEKAITGDLKALDFLLSLCGEDNEPGLDGSEERQLSEQDLEILRDYFVRQHSPEEPKE